MKISVRHHFLCAEKATGSNVPSLQGHKGNCYPLLPPRVFVILPSTSFRHISMCQWTHQSVGIQKDAFAILCQSPAVDLSESDTELRTSQQGQVVVIFTVHHIHHNHFIKHIFKGESVGRFINVSIWFLADAPSEPVCSIVMGHLTFSHTAPISPYVCCSHPNNIWPVCQLNVTSCSDKCGSLTSLWIFPIWKETKPQLQVSSPGSDQSKSIYSTSLVLHFSCYSPNSKFYTHNNP